MSEVFGRLILQRKSEWVNRLKNYKVEANGVAIGQIRNGSSEEFQLPAGKSSIVCKVNWCSSTAYEVDVKPGETVYLKVGMGMKYFWPVYGVLLLALFSRLLFRQYLTPELNIVALCIFIIVMLYFGYYVTIGRKQYLKVEPDKDNVFAK